ncbi:UNVERIFIED_ORG: diguanylate cyclase (GGDEF)-like protein [Burkholderia sp. 1595]|uniref:Diguanylate cyclase (GGDEF)-like protein n=1 Tax=Paraburkholderia terricola TaxID=169427 RepID=A0ABU1LZU4_9BURK|nr:EAL domain-containing protein [Paraburkholderia terricola]MDR6412159.1 diguanylate cyclase (GGDEF)-like protein [Paraburkholderia terricola]
MADAKSEQIRSGLKDWVQHVWRLRPAQFVAWIPAVAVALVIVIWIAVIVRIQTEASEARETAAAATAELASSFSAHIAKTVHDADVVVRWVKYEYERSPATFNVAAYERQGLIAADTALQVTIVGANGEVLQTTTPDAQPVNLADRPHFIAHKTNPDVGLYISQPVLGRVSHHWTLQFTRRLNNPDGSFAGVVVVSEDPNYLTNGFYNLESLGAGGMLAVTSDNGYLLSRLAGEKPASPTGPPASAYREMQDAKGGVFIDPVDHVHRFVTYRHLTQYPVAVLVGLAETNELAGYTHARTLYLLMSGAVTFVLLVAAWLITMMMNELLAGREEMRHLAERMQNLAETDALTGLPNRYLLTETVRRQIGTDRPIERLALLFIDLDNFKRINDALGHDTGDELLQNVARRLAKVAGKERLLARVGGDEFVLIVDGMGASVRARNLAQSIIDAFELAFGLRGNSYVIRVSIGIAVYTDSDDAEYDLLRQADLAMYAAKGDGKPANMSKYRVYTPDLSTRAMRDIERQQELQFAILNGEFFLEYQPIVSLSTGEIRGVEALARWRHPEKGTVMPADFIPFAESTGFIVPIGEQVLEQACAQFSEWQENDPRPLYLSVNVSAAQLVHGDLVRVVHRCLNQYMIDPRRLQLEITETAILEDSAAVTRRLKELRLSGVRVVLDDFGTGYSSLSQLTSLVIDGVKIDRSFTRGVPGDKAALATFNSIASLTRDLGLSLIVEGVETEQQASWLHRLGDIQVQGFYFSRPVAPADLRVGKAA